MTRKISIMLICMLVMSIASGKQAGMLVAGEPPSYGEYYGSVWMSNETVTTVLVLVQNGSANVTLTIGNTYNLYLAEEDAGLDGLNCSVWSYMFNETLTTGEGFITVYPSMNNYSIIVGPQIFNAENDNSNTNENDNSNIINSTIWNFIGSNISEASITIIVLIAVGVAAVVAIAIAQLVKAGRSRR